jgi:NADPH:quinone reductase-like Zn-dependent oxidoreductase
MSVDCIAICGRELEADRPACGPVGVVRLNGRDVRFARVPVDEPRFDPTAPEHARHALVRVAAFSLNFRDKAYCAEMSRVCGPRSFLPVGSEFAGEVVAVGAGVTSVRPGDRVVGDYSYPTRSSAPGGEGVRGGVPTNHASRGLLVLPEASLFPVPAAMPVEVAAAFALNAQTAYSMVRKLAVGPGDTVLVTAARSSASLFSLSALRAAGVRTVAVTTSAGDADRIRAAGADEVVTAAAAGDLASHPELARFAHPQRGFAGVVDPFWDVYLSRVVPLLRSGGRYVTCGVLHQGGDPPPPADLTGTMNEVMLHNRTVIGNCLGERDDLARAVADYAAGRLAVPIDRVYTGDDAARFVDRTFNDPARFGKVVFRYSS